MREQKRSTLPCVKETASADLLDKTGSLAYALCSVLTRSVDERKETPERLDRQISHIYVYLHLTDTAVQMKHNTVKRLFSN